MLRISGDTVDETWDNTFSGGVVTWSLNGSQKISLSQTEGTLLNFDSVTGM
jgi:hypothetical protein